MKKIILGILALIYVMVASGVVIATHYCMGRMQETSYTYRIDNTCSKCGMENKGGCCHTEFKIVKLTDDQQQQKTNFAFNEAAVIHYTLSLLQPIQGIEKNLAHDYYFPPDCADTPLYLSNAVFRI